MAVPFFCIAEGKLYMYDPPRMTEIRSEILDSYTAKIRDAAKRSEWKYSGEGARFTNTFDPGASAESRVEAIRGRILSAQFSGGKLYYALSIGDIAGIYTRNAAAGGGDGIFLSTADESFRELDVCHGSLAASAAFAGESHIGFSSLDRADFRTLTEGHSWDFSPVWSRTDPDLLYFCSAGLSQNNASEEDRTAPTSLPEMMLRMQQSAVPAQKGPCALCTLRLSDGTLDELLSDPKYDYVRPQSTEDGSLYYIRRPYRTETRKPSGCLTDIVLLPVRLIRAVFGFFNLFSMKYSGTPLSSSGDVKQRDEEKMYIDGNLIDAAAVLKENTDKGDKNPGIIPRSWELHRRSPDGKDTLLRRGVCAYRVSPDGTLICSNGMSVLSVLPDGTENKETDTKNVTEIVGYS